MAKYIDKESIKLNYSGLAKIAPNDFIGIAKYFADQIKAIPAADVAPVRHGKWIENYGAPNVKRCSVCKTERCAKDSWWRFCPNCGAKMDGGESDG